MAISTNRIIKNMQSMNLIYEDEIEVGEAISCHMCRKSFKENDIKVQDHWYFTSKYRGAAHQPCNLNYKKKTQTILIVSKRFQGRLNLLPINEEKNISFTKCVSKTKINYRFIYRCRFMASSIDKLSTYLPDSEKKITRT